MEQPHRMPWSHLFPVWIWCSEFSATWAKRHDFKQKVYSFDYQKARQTTNSHIQTDLSGHFQLQCFQSVKQIHRQYIVKAVLTMETERTRQKTPYMTEAVDW